MKNENNILLITAVILYIVYIILMVVNAATFIDAVKAIFAQTAAMLSFPLVTYLYFKYSK